MTGWQDSFQPAPSTPMSPQQAQGIIDVFGQGDAPAKPSGGWQDSFQPLEAQKKPPQASSAEIPDDMAKSAGAGFGRSAANMASEALQNPLTALSNILARPIVQGATRMAGAGYDTLADKTGLPAMSENVAHAMTYPMGGDPNTQDEQIRQMLATQVIPSAVQNATGMDMNYQPQTKPGEYAASVGSSLPYVGFGMAPSSAIGMGVGSQAGKDIAGQFTDNPKYQEAAGVVGGGAGALGSPSAAAKMQDLLKDESTSGTSFVGFPKGVTPPPHYSPDEMIGKAQDYYENSNKIGGSMPKEDIRQVYSNLASNPKIGKQSEEGQTFAGTDTVAQTMADLKDAINVNDKPWSIKAANEIDDSLRSRVQTALRAGDYDTVRRLTIIKTGLKGAYAAAAASDPQGAAGFGEWLKGDQLYSAGSKAQEVHDMIENAQRADVPSTAIKNSFKNFVKNEDTNRGGMTDDEWAAAQHAAQYGVITPILKTLGSRMSGHIAGGLAGLAEGGVTGGAAGYMAGNAVTAPLRWAANARQASRGYAVSDLISERPNVQSLMNAPLAVKPAAPEVLRLPFYPSRGYTPIPEPAAPSEMLGGNKRPVAATQEQITANQAGRTERANLGIYPAQGVKNAENIAPAQAAAGRGQSAMLRQYGSASMQNGLPLFDINPSNPGAAGNAEYVRLQQIIDAQRGNAPVNEVRPIPQQQIPIPPAAPYIDRNLQAQKILNQARARGQPIRNSGMAENLAYALMNMKRGQK